MELHSLSAGIYEFRNSYLHLVVDDAIKLLYSEWLRPPSSQEYREAATIFAGCLQQKGIKYWIQDTNNLGEVPVEDLKWVLQELVPVGAASGLQKLARITSDDRNLGRFMETAAQTQAKLNAAIEVQQFETYREAASWIDDQL
ncbi:hypothetical protein [Adhaeribacter rhizoryzae]|uniref:STAS/SEC14 domain-containing protein n=1 Tax=Adhaeribacter rhizoryzae TaxID=2607907 RepID=A0A5M6DLE8_9BACT|nr:hypothetical protein [Adhaeribacter rhizoryzae]KAA5548364.1 hypothetical protein F0145_06460 [Adhaeribacter rhizoryzae]